MNLSDAKKILIVRFSSLGDVLLTTPLVRTLKNLYPHLQIDFTVKKNFEDVMLNNPYINNVFSFEDFDALTELKKKLRSFNYDAVVDLQNNLRSRKLVAGTSKNIYRFKKPNIKKFLLVNTKINFMKDIVPIPVRYANAIPGLKLDGKSLDLFLPANIKPQLNKTADIIGFCPGSVHKTKMWLEEYFIELGNLLSAKNFKIAIFGGKSDKEICEKISKRISGAINLCNNNKLYKTSINMKQCKAVVCNDSGLMHTAVASGVPVVAIFGSTVKEFGFAPYKTESIVVENNSVTCRPCSHIGKSECPKKHFDCMKTLTPQIVFEKTLNFIENL